MLEPARLVPRAVGIVCGICRSTATRGSEHRKSGSQQKGKGKGSREEFLHGYFGEVGVMGTGAGTGAGVGIWIRSVILPACLAGRGGKGLEIVTGRFMSPFLISSGVFPISSNGLRLASALTKAAVFSVI